jgi:hypothetical protein
LLNHKVEYLLIGGYAVIYYGYERTTADMDLWLRPNNDNKNILIEALREFGIIEEDLKKLSLVDFTLANAFSIEEKPSRIDFLTAIQGVSYDEADVEKALFPIKNKHIPIIQYHHLITSKMLTGRSKDKADVEELQKINKK